MPARRQVQRESRLMRLWGSVGTSNLCSFADIHIHCICVYIYTHTYMYMCAYMYIHIYIYIMCISTCLSIYLFICRLYKCTQALQSHASSSRNGSATLLQILQLICAEERQRCASGRMSAYMYMYMRIHIYIYIGILIPGEKGCLLT